MRSMLMKAKGYVVDWYNTHFRSKIRPEQPIDDWADDLLGEEKITRLEETNEHVKRLIQDTRAEIRALRSERNLHD